MLQHCADCHNYHGPDCVPSSCSLILGCSSAPVCVFSVSVCERTQGHDIRGGSLEDGQTHVCGAREALGSIFL
jgi:hypothetical protein